MTLKIEAGKFYRTRDGRKIGPMVSSGYDGWPWIENHGDGRCWMNDGMAVLQPYNMDIIAEWTDELPHGHARLPSGTIIDLTSITTPFGLLDADTQEAMRAHGGTYEQYAHEGWHDIRPTWTRALTYRVKPKPPEPKVETVTLTGGDGSGFGFYQNGGVNNTHSITFNLIDGEPDVASVRMEKL